MSAQLVLITGASGHLGFRTLVLALRAGYRAICTVRREDQAQKISSRPSVIPFAQNVSFAIVEDISAPHAFDDAMEGVTHIIHIASPIASRIPQSATGEYPPWEEHFYDPAWKGTLTILESASAAPSVRRVIITSSVVVLKRINGAPGAGPNDVQDLPSEEFLKNPPSVFEAYANSKVIAYHAATDFVKEREVAFDLVHVLPGYIQGANELNEKPEDVTGGSNSATMGIALGQVSEGPKLTGQVPLEDVAKAHVLALEQKVAPHLGNLIIAGNGGQGIPWAQIADVIERNYPDEVSVGILRPTKGQQDWLTRFDVRSSEDALGFRFAGSEEMVRSVVGQYLQLLRQ